MKKTYAISKLIDRLRVDIIAILLVTFVFQLIAPAVVLAAPVSDADEFQKMLRDSICRVILVEDQNAENGNTPPITDRFVCDLCILCSVDSLGRQPVLPVALFIDPLSGLDPSYATRRSAEPTRAFCLSTATPRAPPFG